MQPPSPFPFRFLFSPLLFALLFFFLFFFTDFPYVLFLILITHVNVILGSFCTVTYFHAR